MSSLSFGKCRALRSSIADVSTGHYLCSTSHGQAQYPTWPRPVVPGGRGRRPRPGSSICYVRTGHRIAVAWHDVLS
eukprot:2202497-Rhodomonas_salina.2